MGGGRGEGDRRQHFGSDSTANIAAPKVNMGQERWLWRVRPWLTRQHEEKERIDRGEMPAPEEMSSKVSTAEAANRAELAKSRSDGIFRRPSRGGGGGGGVGEVMVVLALQRNATWQQPR